MVRRKATVCLVLVAFSISTCSASVQAAGLFGGGTGGGLLARLNKPIIPGMQTLPGMPTASPLGLIAPRLSNAVLIFQKGGLRTPAGRLSGIGVLSPRVSPLVAMFTAPPRTRQAQAMYGLTILSPRLAVLAGMLRAARGMTAGIR
jgi:hypothetical protein